ncbi:COG0730 Predicted permeases [Rhabdaerophilaceae bacterium]
MISDPVFYLAAVPAVIVFGLAKGGFAGLSLISMILLALVINPVKAAAIILPIMIVQDLVGLWAFRKIYDGKALAILLPGAMLGIVIGYVTAAYVSEAAVRLLIGLIAVLFAGSHFLGLVNRLSGSPAVSGHCAGAFWGTVSGFTSFISHAGGPPFQVWMLPRRPDRDMMVGTTTWFFAIVNLVKAPFFVGLGHLDRSALMTAGLLMPLAIASTLAGIWLVRRLPVERFYTIIYALLLLTGLIMTYFGISALTGSADA